VVEYSSSGGLSQPHEVSQSGVKYAFGHVGDGTRILDVFHRRVSCPGPKDYPAKRVECVVALRKCRLSDMEWGSFNEFFAMGGYGLYVWGSYLVTVVCILVEILTVRRG
jgi:hypothetical protein